MIILKGKIKMRSQKCKIKQVVIFTIFLLLMNNLIASIVVNNETPKINQTGRGKDILEESTAEFKFKQPDGIAIVLEGVLGGLNNYFMFRKNGYTVIRDLESRHYCWVYQDENGQLESTGYPVHLYDPNELGLKKDIRMSEEEYQRIRNIGPFYKNQKN